MNISLKWFLKTMESKYIPEMFFEDYGRMTLAYCPPTQNTFPNSLCKSTKFNFGTSLGFIRTERRRLYYGTVLWHRRPGEGAGEREGQSWAC